MQDPLQGCIFQCAFPRAIKQNKKHFVSYLVTLYAHANNSVVCARKKEARVGSFGACPCGFQERYIVPPAEKTITCEQTCLSHHLS